MFTGTNRYFRRIAAEVGLDVSFADCTKPEVLKAALKPNTKVGLVVFFFFLNGNICCFDTCKVWSLKNTHLFLL